MRTDRLGTLFGTLGAVATVVGYLMWRDRYVPPSPTELRRDSIAEAQTAKARTAATRAAVAADADARSRWPAQVARCERGTRVYMPGDHTRLTGTRSFVADGRLWVEVSATYHGLERGSPRDVHRADLEGHVRCGFLPIRPRKRPETTSSVGRTRGDVTRYATAMDSGSMTLANTDANDIGTDPISGKEVRCFNAGLPWECMLPATWGPRAR